MSNRKSPLVLLIIAGIIILADCQKEAQVNDLADQNKAVVIKAFEALNNLDYDQLGEFIAQDYVRHCQATPDIEVKSLDEFIATVKMWAAAFPDMKMENHIIIAEDDMVGFYVTFSGTHEGPMGQYPATGKTIESETFGFHRLEEGKIVESWITLDNLTILTQLGLLPPPAEEDSK